LPDRSASGGVILSGDQVDEAAVSVAAEAAKACRGVAAGTGSAGAEGSAQIHAAGTDFQARTAATSGASYLADPARSIRRHHHAGE
jgi:hypothetical protein